MKKSSKVCTVLLCVCLIISLFPTFGFAEELSDDIVILYTSDIHGGVDSNLELAGVAAYANEMRTKNKYVEIVDAGDAISGTMLASTSKGEFVVESMNAAGYTIAVPGVHDFDFGVSNLTGKLSLAAEYKYLSCNFETVSDSKTVFSPYRIETYGNTKVAYIGISDPKTRSKSGAYFKNGDGAYAYSFNGANGGSDLYDKVQQTIDKAKKEGAKYIIAIGHLTAEDGEEYSAKSVIENTSGINAFINGNTHASTAGDMVKTKDSKYALLTCAGAGLKRIGVMKISDGKTITSQLIGSYTLRDIKTKNAIDNLKKQYEANLKEAFATTSSKLEAANSGGIRIVESGETNLGDLCADAYRAAAGADVAFVEAREIRSNIPLGNISYNDVISALPLNDTLSVVKVTGYDILDALEMSVRMFPNRNPGFLQVSGLTFDIQETIVPSVKLDENGNFIEVSDDYRVTNIMINGEPLDLMEDYTVMASNSFLNGETGYTMFKTAPLKSANVTTDNQSLVSFISTKLGGTVGAAYSKSQVRIDSIKLARQSEIDLAVEKKVKERIKDYDDQLSELKKLVETQQQVIAIKSMNISASSYFGKSKSGKRYIKVTWKTSQDLKGAKYQLYKSTKKTSGYKKLISTSGKYCTNTTGLTKGKTYYYKVRAYKYIGGKYYFSNWSNVTYKKVYK